MALSQATFDTLNDLAKKAKAVADAAKAKNISVNNAFDDGSPVKALADDLTALLTDDGQIEKLLQASQDMKAQHEALARKHPLTGDDFRQLGILAAGATVLSAQALALAVTRKQIFLYTMQQIWPWLQQGAKLGLEIASLAQGPGAA